MYMVNDVGQIIVVLFQVTQPALAQHATYAAIAHKTSAEHNGYTV